MADEPESETMINMTTAQRDTLERFLESVKDTFYCDDAVTVYWANMWLCIERDGYAHT